VGCSDTDDEAHEGDVNYRAGNKREKQEVTAVNADAPNRRLVFVRGFVDWLINGSVCSLGRSMLSGKTR
jgi:hypothetical protein